MTTIKVIAEVGSFAEDKDAAARLRNDVILPRLNSGDAVELDFGGVTLATQSFIHALISEALRREGPDVLERLSFKDCTETTRGIIETVVQYVLESMDGGN